MIKPIRIFNRQHNVMVEYKNTKVPVATNLGSPITTSHRKRQAKLFLQLTGGFCVQMHCETEKKNDT